MTQDRDTRIRDRAYRIWESEGRPEDRHHVHWDIATRIIDEEDRAEPVAGDPVDEAVAESFPASDPPAPSDPTRGVETDPTALDQTTRRRRRA